MKNLFLILTVITFSYGCKKDPGNKNTLTLYGNYRSASTAQLSPVIMLTKNNIISDTSFIKNFLLRAGDFNTFYYNTKTQTIGSGFVDLNMNGKDDVKIAVNNRIIYPTDIFPPYTISGHVVIQLPSEFLIQSLKADSGNFIKPDTTIYSVEKYKPFFKFISYSSSLGGINNGLYIGLGRQPIVIQSGNYYFPILAYLVKRFFNPPSMGYSSEEFGTPFSNNIINPNLQAELGPADTVVVQTGLVKLIKQ